MRLRYYVDAKVKTSSVIDACVKSRIHETDAKVCDVFYAAVPILFTKKMPNSFIDAVVLGDSLNGLITILNGLENGIILGDKLTIKNSIHSSFGSVIAMSDVLEASQLLKVTVEDVMVMDDEIVMQCNVRSRFSDLMNDTFETLKTLTLGEIDFITR